MGPPGNRGPPGNAGARGMNGTMGMKGENGSKGDSGMIGALGDRGRKGYQGNKGIDVNVFKFFSIIQPKYREIMELLEDVENQYVSELFEFILIKIGLCGKQRSYWN